MAKKRKKSLDVIYTVEEVCGHRRLESNGGYKYLIKWQGYPESDNTWQHQEDILDKTLIEDYWTKYASKMEVIASGPRAEPPAMAQTILKGGDGGGNDHFEHDIVPETPEEGLEETEDEACADAREQPEAEPRTPPRPMDSRARSPSRVLSNGWEDPAATGGAGIGSAGNDSAENGNGSADWFESIGDMFQMPDGELLIRVLHKDGAFSDEPLDIMHELYPFHMCQWYKSRLQFYRQEVVEDAPEGRPSVVAAITKSDTTANSFGDPDAIPTKGPIAEEADPRTPRARAGSDTDSERSSSPSPYIGSKPDEAR